jgi:hypothetical protein
MHTLGVFIQLRAARAPARLFYLGDLQDELLRELRDPVGLG